MKTNVVVFPFDLFGSAGSGAGAQLLGDAIREMLDDARRETKPARCESYRDSVRIKEHRFDTAEAVADWRRTGRKAARASLKSLDFLIWLAGNHLGVLPLYEELGPDTLVIQLDAHLDIFNLGETTEELSHGNFLLHSETELPSTINLGHRDLFLKLDHIEKHFLHAITSIEMHRDAIAVEKRLASMIRSAKRIVLDIDCDVFDPAYFPATTHPQPFGISPTWLTNLVEMIGHEKLIGVAISEFEPGRDLRDQSLSTLIWFMEWLLLWQHESTGRKQ